MDDKRTVRAISLGQLTDEEAAVLVDMIVDETNKRYWRMTNEFPVNTRPQ